MIGSSMVSPINSLSYRIRAVKASRVACTLADALAERELDQREVQESRVAFFTIPIVSYFPNMRNR